MDARQFTRVATRHPVTVTRTDGTSAHGILRDVALRGIFVSEVQAELASPVMIRIQLDVHATIEAQGHVARCTTDGIAIALDELIGAESLEHLRQLVLLNTRSATETSRVGQEIERNLPIAPA